MGNYGVKLRKPEELPDFDQPSDYEEEKRRFEPGASVSGYVEQVLREHLDQYKEDVERWRKL